MFSLTLFAGACLIAFAAALLAAFSKSGEQETLAGIIGLVAFILAAVGGLARVYGI
jgi:membrane-associated phospholipid phosphatase